VLIAVKLHSFLNSTLGGSRWLTLHPGSFNPRKESLYLIGDWCGLQDIAGNFALAGIRTLEGQPIA
jgi:hypothetical protein